MNITTACGPHAPFSLDMRLQLLSFALPFFSPMHYNEVVAAMGQPASPGKVRLFTVSDFIQYLQVVKGITLEGAAQTQLDAFLKRLESRGVLANGGRRGLVFADTYITLVQLTKLQKEGQFWLTRALGAEFAYRAFETITMQLTGITAKGDVAAGTAIAIAPHWLLTCAHVLKEITVDAAQQCNGTTLTVEQIYAHDSIDVGLVKVAEALPSSTGLGFRDPVICETVYTLGYPRIYQASHSALVMQRGEITAQQIQLMDLSEVFLFSAVARPGNSGGPIVADSGHVVGIVIDELTSKELEGTVQFPFHAGVPTYEIVKAMADLVPSLQLPIETFQ